MECYAYRKSFGLFLFLEELLQKIDPALRASYNLCQRFPLPQKKQNSSKRFLGDGSNIDVLAVSTVGVGARARTCYWRYNKRMLLFHNLPVRRTQ